MKIQYLPMSRSRQQGVVLVISLLMLLVLTVIGLAATRGTALEERMAANQTDRNVAFQAAEAALRYGEGQLSGAAQPVFAANTAGAYYQPTMPSTVYWGTASFWTTSSNVGTYGGGIQPAPSQAPEYYIVQTNAETPVQGASLSVDQQQQMQTVYYIYAKGWGTSGNTAVILESSYRE